MFASLIPAFEWTVSSACDLSATLLVFCQTGSTGTHLHIERAVGVRRAVRNRRSAIGVAASNLLVFRTQDLSGTV